MVPDRVAGGEPRTPVPRQKNTPAPEHEYAAAPEHEYAEAPGRKPAPEPITTGSASERPFRVLMVCTANRVRSAMAERMLRHALAAVAPGLAVVITGAGTRALDGQPMFPQAAAELERRGIDASGFRSRALTENGVMHADLVLTATREHRSAVLERAPLALKRTFTLLEFAALVATPSQPEAGAPNEVLSALVRRSAAGRGAASIAHDEYDITDPAGLALSEYEYAAQLIDYATFVIAQAFARAVGAASAPR